ncbi:hypothetical protein UNH65_22585 [Chitinophaga sp. 180180018-2]|nr:hypothetical protein [Chitinophaga sp. 212800010-3]
MTALCQQEKKDFGPELPAFPYTECQQNPILNSVKIYIMKHYLIAASLLCSIAASAQKVNVPAAVKAALAKQFPTAANVKWELEKGNYEAGFKENNQHVSAVFDASGKWLETESAIPKTELPKQAAEYISSHYKNGKIKETAKIQKAGGEVNYEVEVNGKDVIFNSDGTFLKEEKG